LKVTLVAVGQKMPDWIEAGYNEYIRRLPAHLKPTLKELKADPRSGATDARAGMAAEGERILAAVPTASHLICLDERGKSISSLGFAKALGQWQAEGQNPTWVIGGADGLAPEVKAAAQSLWSLSALTLPHGMVRVLLAEQLYRAWTILENHPYHRV
jgi:23S rRNA (pseudouridine1915-N3)-methyltransferase